MRSCNRQALQVPLTVFPKAGARPLWVTGEVSLTHNITCTPENHTVTNEKYEYGYQSLLLKKGLRVATAARHQSGPPGHHLRALADAKPFQ